MAMLVVLAFKDETSAERMRDKLAGLQKLQLIRLADAAVVVRRQEGKVKVKQAVSLVGAGALGGAFWGMLIGLLFWAPWLGLAIGAASGALVVSIGSFFWRLFPLIRKMDRDDQIEPKRYSVVLGWMILAFIMVFLIAIVSQLMR